MLSALEQIKLDEGFSSKCYDDSLGIKTIGYGRNIQDVGITRYEAEFLLANDLDMVSKQAMRFSFYKQLKPARRAVILNMIFNIGLTRFSGFKKMIAALNKEDYKEASIEMLDSKWAGQVGARAIRLAKQMESGR